MLTNQRKRALHDFIAGTLVVVREEKDKVTRFAPVFAVLSFLGIGLCVYGYIQNKSFFDQYSAKDGQPRHQRAVGDDFFKGTKDAPRDYAQAYSWFQKAAAGNEARAQYQLGLMNEMGYSVNANRDEAIKWYRLAAKNGDRKAKAALKRLGVGSE